jgi:predicted O-linked N-acetylglucosamine transferase (SPINDLY family)/predicted O-methyltransferase YrrM
MHNDIANSELNRLISPEIKHDEFYTAIQRIAREEDIKTVLEIGSSSGEGSTEAFVTGLRENPNKPTLFCMEVSITRFTELKKRYENESFVKPYNVSSVPVGSFPDEKQVVDFYHHTQNNLKFYPIEIVIGWLRQDIEYIRQSGVFDNGIQQIKQENNIDVFDLVLIDGSEFTGNAELDEVYGAKYILLDDINTFKNYKNFNELLTDANYVLIAYNQGIRNGYAIFKHKKVKPINYKTVQKAVESLEGFMVPGQEEYLFNKVQTLPEDAVIVEIGSFKGRSTVAMAYACIGTRRKIYSIDTWDGNDSDFSERQFFEIWQQNVQNNGLEDYVLPLRGYSHDILKGWHKLADGKAIDFIFIDGSHQYLDVLKDFEMSFPLVKDGGWIAFHDVIHTWTGPERVWHKTAKLHLINHEYSSSLACGQKNFAAITSSTQKLSTHFFTIVLNGQPFIQYHIEVFKQLPFKWHWHIIEGVADLKHDTGWSIQLGGSISDKIHKNGRSHDGTTEYINELAQLYPDNITIYRKPESIFWDGKREMVNAPLKNIKEECLLWQVDVDELWTLEQICTAREMFISNPDKTAAFYWCWYFVGEKLIISTRNCYAQNPQQEWLRTWRFKPGYIWEAHEPPVLVEPLADGQYKNIAATNPFSHQETEQHDLVFQHFAYVTQEQLSFKEKYYGYRNAVSQWLSLQKNTKFPTLLREYFPWVQDATQVDVAYSWGIVPIAQRELSSNDWKFLQQNELQEQITHIKKTAPIILVDGVFFQLYQTGIARVWKSLLEEWVNSGFAKHIIVLDRAGTAPKIPGIRYRTVERYDYKNTNLDRNILQQICDQEGVDLFISSYYTTPTTTPCVFMAYDMIPEVMGWDMNNPMWQEKHQGIQHASAYIAISEHTAHDLTNCFSDISKESVTVAYCGVSSTFSPADSQEINAFKDKYGITKPYFLSVGGGSGYKNGVLFFKAFSQLANSYGFDIICTGSSGLLVAEFRAYTSGSTVQMLQLSDEELAIAYSGAMALVYPSKYEGFGMPVIEAMACGCPVITCANASIPEVAGEAAIYINDDDVNGLANALCEVQKPSVRKSLITAGLAQAQKFSWSKMATIVSSALIDATLLNLNLKEINLIIFPDWSQPEELISLELERAIKTLATHPESEKTTLLIDTSDIAVEDAELFLSSVTMNLLMQEYLDITEGLEISLVGDLADIQWEALLSRINARIIVEHENQQALMQAKAENLAFYEIESFSQARDEQFFCLSNQLFQEGRWQEAIAQYQKLLEMQAGDVEIYWRLSHCYRQLNLIDEYFNILHQGIKLYPTEGKFHFTLIIDLRRNGRIQEAITSAENAAKCLPDDYTFQILKYLTIPSVYNNQEEINFYRQRFIQGLQDLIQQTSLKTPEERNSALASIGRLTNFYLSYQAQNDIDLQRQYGKLVHEIMAANFPQWIVPLSMPKLQPHQKIRIGYVSHYLHSYSGTLWLTGWLRYCDHENFEIYCYYTGNEPDPVTQQFQKYSDVFHHIPHNLSAACEQIISDKLHILVFPEIGMNPQTMQMAGLRLAPVQCVAWGHPVTTGLPTIDYFLSSELMEAENAQEHYSEKLILLPNIGVSYPKPHIPPVVKTCSDFQLSDDAVIYLSCQAPFKYLPQYDFIFAEIARRVPQAKFVFLRGILLHERLKRAFAAIELDYEDYCVFLSIPERLDYLMINLLSDVYLDTFTWSGGNTTLEAIACNLPIVTCSGEFMRGRHSDSFLKMLGVTDTIAKNEAEYIEIAVKLGLDPVWRHEISERISQRHDRLFDDQVCIAGLEAFYKKVVE